MPVRAVNYPKLVNRDGFGNLRKTEEGWSELDTTVKRLLEWNDDITLVCKEVSSELGLPVTPKPYSTIFENLHNELFFPRQYLGYEKVIINGGQVVYLSDALDSEGFITAESLGIQIEEKLNPKK